MQRGILTNDPHKEVLAVRPKLKDYVFFAPLTDGVLFRSVTGEVVFRGPDVYRWIERLTPYLNGQHTLEELGRNLDEKRRAKVESLIKQLVASDLVRDVE